MTIETKNEIIKSIRIGIDDNILAMAKVDGLERLKMAQAVKELCEALEIIERS